MFCVKLNKEIQQNPAHLFFNRTQSCYKMSSTLFSNASPFAAALPAAHVFTAYDVDGDAIMTDAVTGLPITYGGSASAPAVSGSKRTRSASMDSDSTDSRPSKRSRTSDEDDGENDGEGGVSAPAPSYPPPPPPAPMKAPRSSTYRDDENDGEGGSSATRNLATAMAEAVLAGEPRSPTSVIGPWFTGSSSNAAAWGLSNVGAGGLADVGPSPGGGSPHIGSSTGEGGYCVSVTCPDLSLRLDMRHPRVVLHLLRFVAAYNDYAPLDEDIHFPWMESDVIASILSHEFVTHPPPECQAEVVELKQLIEKFSCQCPDCKPDNWSDDWDRHTSDDDSE